MLNKDVNGAGSGSPKGKYTNYGARGGQPSIMVPSESLESLGTSKTRDLLMASSDKLSVGAFSDSRKSGASTENSMRKSANNSPHPRAVSLETNED